MFYLEISTLKKQSFPQIVCCHYIFFAKKNKNSLFMGVLASMFTYSSSLVINSGKSNTLYQNVIESREQVESQFSLIFEAIQTISQKVESLANAAEEQSASTEEMASATNSSAKSMLTVSEQVDYMLDNIKEIARSNEQVNRTA